jgi:hypothetical protein
MGLWSRIQSALWTGEVVKDYGAISERSIGSAKRSLTAVLSKKRGRRLFLRESYRGFGAFRINFIELDRDEVFALDAVLHDALEQM